MVNSQDINKLRPDVVPNAKLWLAECRAKGLDVEISNTVRDNEYQAYLYAQGRTRPGKIVTNGKTTTFHGSGLAIDFYSKSKGWSDHNFFVQCGTIAKKHGFSWAGDWTKFIEYCHIQWDNHGKSTYKNAPQMPLYEEVEDMTKEEVRAIAKEEAKAQTSIYHNLDDVPLWGKPTVEKLLKSQAITGDGTGIDLPYETLRLLVINDRMGLYGK